MFSAGWALKRLYKFVLKRLLGNVLKNELDLEQVVPCILFKAALLEYMDNSPTTEDMSASTTKQDVYFQPHPELKGKSLMFEGLTLGVGNQLIEDVPQVELQASGMQEVQEDTEDTCLGFGTDSWQHLIGGHDKSGLSGSVHVVVRQAHALHEKPQVAVTFALEQVHSIATPDSLALLHTVLHPYTHNSLAPDPDETTEVDAHPQTKPTKKQYHTEGTKEIFSPNSKGLYGGWSVWPLIANLFVAEGATSAAEALPLVMKSQDEDTLSTSCTLGVEFDDDDPTPSSAPKSPLDLMAASVDLAASVEEFFDCIEGSQLMASSLIISCQGKITGVTLALPLRTVGEVTNSMRSFNKMDDAHFLLSMSNVSLKTEVQQASCSVTTDIGCLEVWYVDRAASNVCGGTKRTTDQLEEVQSMLPPWPEFAGQSPPIACTQQTDDVAHYTPVLHLVSSLSSTQEGVPNCCLALSASFCSKVHSSKDARDPTVQQTESAQDGLKVSFQLGPVMTWVDTNRLKGILELVSNLTSAWHKHADAAGQDPLNNSMEKFHIRKFTRGTQVPFEDTMDSGSTTCSKDDPLPVSVELVCSYLRAVVCFTSTEDGSQQHSPSYISLEIASPASSSKLITKTQHMKRSQQKEDEIQIQPTWRYKANARRMSVISQLSGVRMHIIGPAVQNHPMFSSSRETALHCLLDCPPSAGWGHIPPSRSGEGQTEPFVIKWERKQLMSSANNESHVLLTNARQNVLTRKTEQRKDGDTSEGTIHMGTEQETLRNRLVQMADSMVQLVVPPLHLHLGCNLHGIAVELLNAAAAEILQCLKRISKDGSTSMENMSSAEPTLPLSQCSASLMALVLHCPSIHCNMFPPARLQPIIPPHMPTVAAPKALELLDLHFQQLAVTHVMGIDPDKQSYDTYLHLEAKGCWLDGGSLSNPKLAGLESSASASLFQSCAPSHPTWMEASSHSQWQGSLTDDSFYQPDASKLQELIICNHRGRCVESGCGLSVEVVTQPLPAGLTPNSSLIETIVGVDCHSTAIGTTDGDLCFGWMGDLLRSLQLTSKSTDSTCNSRPSATRILLCMQDTMVRHVPNPVQQELSTSTCNTGSNATLADSSPTLVAGVFTANRLFVECTFVSIEKDPSLVSMKTSAQVTDVGLYTASQPLAGGLAGPLQGGAVIHTPLPTSFTDLHSTGFVWVARETQLNVQVHSEGNPTPGCGPNAIQVEVSNHNLVVETFTDSFQMLSQLLVSCTSPPPELDQQVVLDDEEKTSLKCQGVVGVLGQRGGVEYHTTNSSRGTQDPVSKCKQEKQTSAACSVAAALNGPGLIKETKMRTCTNRSTRWDPVLVERPESSKCASETGQQQESAPHFIEDFYADNTDDEGDQGAFGENGNWRSPRADNSAQWYSTCGGAGVKIRDDHLATKQHDVGSHSCNGSPHQCGPSHEKKNLNLPPASLRVLLHSNCIIWRFRNQIESQSAATTAETTAEQPLGLEIRLEGTEVQHVQFEFGHHHASRWKVGVRDCEALDMTASASFPRVVSYYSHKGEPRESSSKMLHFELESVRPDPNSVLVEEYRVLSEVLPLRLCLDQHMLDFLNAFFNATSSAPTEAVPDLDSPGADSMGAEKEFNIEETSAEDVPLESLAYIQRCEVRQGRVRIDYKPRHVNFNAIYNGNYAELINLVPWDGITLKLKAVRITGLHGWQSVITSVLEDWLEDLCANQRHKFVQGMAPVKSLCTVSKGAAQLVQQPYQQYRRDGRIFRGLKKGAEMFLRSVTLEALGLGAQVAGGAHHVLERAEVALQGNTADNPGTSQATVLRLSPRAALGEMRPFATSRDDQSFGRNGDCRGSREPTSVREGLSQAATTLSRGIGSGAKALLADPMKAYKRGASPGAVFASAVKAMPRAAVSPATAVAGAVKQTLVGVRNGLNPDKS